MPGFESFLGPVFEQICIQALKEQNRAGRLPFRTPRIGRWWDRRHEIDIVAYDHEPDGGNYLLCECTWTSKPVGLSVLEKLEAKSAVFPRANRASYGLFSKSGFHEELLDTAASRDDVLLLDYRAR